MIRWLSILWLIFSACVRPAPDKLMVAVASNAQYTMEEMLQAFSKKTGFECDLVVSSSGKLSAQIIEGAPFDLLVSADMKYPESLYHSGITMGKPVVYAFGKLVLWSASPDRKPLLEDLVSSEVTHVAIANPSTAPYGEAAVEFLQSQGLYEAVSNKLVYGESISQTNQFILSGAAELGITAKSVVLSGPLMQQGHWMEINPESHSSLAQGIVIIKNQNIELSKQFLEFLLSPEGQEILLKYGYDVG